MLSLGCGSARGVAPDQFEKVTVLAAASTAEAIEEVAGLLEQRDSRVRIEISTGSSNGLAQQVLSGAPADLFISANKEWADVVVEEGMARETVELLSNRLVLIAPRGNPAKVGAPADLVAPRLSRVAIAGDNVPAGVYGEQALRSLMLFDELRESGRLVRGSNVRITMAYVERGEADAGIVYATDARISDRVEVVASFDARTHDSIVYSAVLLKSESERAASTDFFQFLQSAAARAVFDRYGFAPPASQP
jgi:molybdate transport system substrate-binding protein